MAMRIGAVNYLNSRPLIEGLPWLAPDDELVLDFPSRLADALDRGDLDVALVPSIACLLRPDYEVVSDACVASRGPVLSVKLFSRVSPREIRTLALDEGSRTSATLVRVLLAERFGIHPETQPVPLDADWETSPADAVLLIGDRCMHEPRGVYHTVWDLGEEWTRDTGLPFVFAMWTARRGSELGDLEERLMRARDLGVSQLDEIACREAPSLGISETLARKYLRENLHFRLGIAERRGLERFAQLAAKHRLAPGGIELVYRHHALA